MIFITLCTTYLRWREAESRFNFKTTRVMTTVRGIKINRSESVPRRRRTPQQAHGRGNRVELPPA